VVAKVDLVYHYAKKVGAKRLIVNFHGVLLFYVNPEVGTERLETVNYSFLCFFLEILIVNSCFLFPRTIKRICKNNCFLCIV